MVKVEVGYEGELRCEAVHGPSGTKVITDAPVDNQGLGQSFSPTDLVATALASCMGTIMGIAARSRGYDLEGMKIVVEKGMSAEGARRISELRVQVIVPLADDHEDRKVLEAAGMGCPVMRSINPEIQVMVRWDWVGK